MNQPLLEGGIVHRIVDQARVLKTSNLWMFQTYHWMISNPERLTIENEKILQDELLKLGWETQRVDYSVLNCDGRHYYTKIVAWPANRYKFAKCLSGTCLSVVLCGCFGGSIIHVM